jgi:hypothetical protein
MVASKRFGVSSKVIIRLLECDFELRIVLSWEGDSEKKAVSELDAAAEQNNKTKTDRNPAIKPAEEARSVLFNDNIMNA